MGEILINSESGRGRKPDFFLTIPTAGAHPFALAEIIQNAGLPPERVILVRTAPSARLPSDCKIIDDFGPSNIQRWWNLGIREACSQGGTAIAVMNDDCRIGVGALAALFETLRSSGAAISTPVRPGESAKHSKRLSLPYRPVLQGSLWMLDLKTTLRPDESFVWWFGDNDLDICARRDFGGVASCEIDFQHLFSGEGTAKSDALTRAANLDERTFETKHSTLLRWHRWSLLDWPKRVALAANWMHRKIRGAGSSLE